MWFAWTSFQTRIRLGEYETFSASEPTSNRAYLFHHRFSFLTRVLPTRAPATEAREPLTGPGVFISALQFLPAWWTRHPTRQRSAPLDRQIPHLPEYNTPPRTSSCRHPGLSRELGNHGTLGAPPSTRRHRIRLWETAIARKLLKHQSDSGAAEPPHGRSKP
jgi:hypothetical protein